MIGKPFGLISYSFAPWLTLILSLFALRAEGDKHQRRKLFDQQRSLEKICSMSWQEFEVLVGEAYRRQGYRVEENSGGGADGGVDLILRRNSETVLVQCKRWKQARVGAPTVRELRGAVARDGATRGIFVTSGAFTKEARAEALGQPIELMDGAALLVLIQKVQGQKLTMSNMPPAPVTANQIAPPTCPFCQSTMVPRTTRQGGSAGSQFWGCPTYPRCRGTRPM